jgi:tetratricopeptide (TPR) repeat protein
MSTEKEIQYLNRKRSIMKQTYFILLVIAGLLISSCQKTNDDVKKTPAPQSSQQNVKKTVNVSSPQPTRHDHLLYEDKVKVMDGLWRARRLQSEHEFEEAFSVFKETIMSIPELYPSKTRELKIDVDADMEKVISDITDEFVRNGFYDYQVEASELLKESLPHSFISVSEAYDAAEVYLTELNDHQKASDSFRYVMEACVPEFYKGLNWNDCCSSSAQYLSLLYGGDSRSVSIWQRIMKENATGPLDVWVRRMLYIKQNFAAQEPKAFSLYLTATLHEKQKDEAGMIDTFQRILHEYSSWKFNPYLYQRLFSFYKGKCLSSGSGRYCESMIDFADKYLFEYADFELPSGLFKNDEHPAAALIRLGDYLYEKGRFKDSIAYYRKVVTDYPVDIGNLRGYGMTQLSPIALLNIGMVFESGLKDYARAVEVYRDVIQGYPETSSYSDGTRSTPAVTAHFRIARIYSRNLEDIDSAEKELREVYKKSEFHDLPFLDMDEDASGLENRSREEALLRLSDIYVKTKRFDKAVAALKEIIYKYAHLAFQTKVRAAYTAQKHFQGLRPYPGRRKAPWLPC